MRSPGVFLLIAALLIGSALAMLFSASMHTSPIRSHDDSAASRTAVRTYYAGVGAFLATGDLLPVRQSLASEMLLLQGSPSQTADLECFLLALRETYPSLAFDVLSIVSAGENVLAELEINRGAPAVPRQFDVPATEAPERVIEMFDVADGKISRRWSSWTGLGLYAPYPAPSIDMTLAPGQSLALARIEVADDKSASFGIPGEALIIVRRGQLQIERPGRVSVYRGSSALSEPAGIGSPLSLNTGDAILLHDWNTVVSTSGQETTTLLAAVATPSKAGYADHGQSAGLSLFDQALESPDGMEIGDFIEVTPLAQSESVNGKQQIRVSSNLLMLSPGYSMTIHQPSGEILVAAIAPSDSLEQQNAGGKLIVTNRGQELLSFWSVLVLPDT